MREYPRGHVPPDATAKPKTPEKSVFQRWREEGDELEPTKFGGERVKMRELGRKDFVFTDKEGVTHTAVETFSYSGTGGYQIDITMDKKNVAFLRYTGGERVISMGKTNVRPEFQDLKINKRLFQDMSDLHPAASAVYTKLDGTNTDVYLKSLQEGADPVAAARKTPAGKIREAAGWVIDKEASTLPEWTEGHGFHRQGDVLGSYGGAIRLVYKRDSAQSTTEEVTPLAA